MLGSDGVFVPNPAMADGKAVLVAFDVDITVFCVFDPTVLNVDFDCPVILGLAVVNAAVASDGCFSCIGYVLAYEGGGQGKGAACVCGCMVGMLGGDVMQ